MDVVAFLPRPLLSHLRIILGSGHSLTPVFTWGELHATVKHLVTDLVVADPGASGKVEVEHLEELRRQFPSLPVVIYTSLAPAGIKAIVRLAKSGVEHVVLARFDDERTPYRPLRRARFGYDYDDFAHLARVAEWSSGATADEEA